MHTIRLNRIKQKSEGQTMSGENILEVQNLTKHFKISGK